MYDKTRSGILLFIVTLFVVSFLGRGAAAQERHVLKLGTIAAPAHVGSYPQNVKFAELVKAKTHGRVEVQVIGSSQLGDERKLAESLQMGILDLAGVTPIILANWEKKLEIFGLPYTFNSFKAMYHVQYGAIGKDAAEGLRKKAGIRILTYITGNYRQFFTTKQVNTIEDMKGLKLRSMENPVYIALFKALGSNPVPMGFGEVFTSLKSGVIDGFDMPAWVVPISKMHEVVRYCAVTNHVVTPFTISVSERSFAKYPADIQKALMEAAAETARWHDPRIEKLEEETLRDLPNVKVSVTRPDLAPFKAVGKKIVMEWAKKNDMVDTVTGILAME